MQKLKMQTPNKINENVERIATLFPNCVTESIDKDGNSTKVVDFDLLKQELSDFAVEGQEERYQFTWADKKKSILLANSPISKTLRPCREESVNFDTTKNLYIEGDNLDVLKLLQETYLGKVKMIYIDPPYNTGNDFVYEDDFAISTEEYFERSGASDDEGNRLFQNNDSNGRFHTDWLNMIYPRLKLARDLLTDDGVIFISIDDNEMHNLRKICDDVFGASNFIASIIWKRKRGRDNSARWFSKAHEYLLLFAKSKDYFNTNFLELDNETKQAYKNIDNDPRGEWRMLACWARGTQGGVSYDFTTKTGQFFSKRLWLFSKINLEKLDQEDKLVIRGDNIYRKMFITENRGKIPETLWDNVSNAANAADEIKRLFDGNIVFDTSKPIPYIIEMLKVVSNKNSLVLDFFSGAATTAHAVMQLNAEDGGNRKFIMVQLPEETPEDSEAQKAGYKTICEIGKERIRRAGKKIADENKLTAPNLDIGFRVLKIDSSNMKPVFYNPQAISQNLLSNTESNIKEDRTPEDLLFQVMLDMGVDLASPIIVEQIGNKKGFVVGDNNLICCFDKDVTKEAVTEIAKRKPLYAVFRDNGFERDDVMISFDQIFETYSPATTRRVI